MAEPIRVLAIDPGNKQSAWLIYGGGRIFDKGIDLNAVVLDKIKDEGFAAVRCVIEDVQSYGMPVGRDVFDTVFWIGRFFEAWSELYKLPVSRLGRIEIKMHLCHTARAKDSNIRQALIDRFGPPGVKSAPGLTYGISKDLWSALAIAVTYSDKQGLDPEPEPF